MPIDRAQARRYVQEFEFGSLFVNELGWDRFRARPLDMSVDNHAYRLVPVAEKRGFQVFQCSPDRAGAIPSHANRLKIDREVAKQAHEHIVIFVDAEQRVQNWQWVRKQSGAPLAVRTETYRRGETAER